ncbi:hypothetical protein [Synechococcus sp. MIT S9504]|uniref:hypothetical protein n=1 Tax=Synechococcus sp. MIT S9504 TaxID=1801628 RepID=UPI001E40749E|nr:hypothetical protein [Synechococcus sp. MIT S9504]
MDHHLHAPLSTLNTQGHGPLSQCRAGPGSHRWFQQAQIDKAEASDQQQCAQARRGESHTLAWTPQTWADGIDRNQPGPALISK